LVSLGLLVVMSGLAVVGVDLPPALSWLEGLTCLVTGVSAGVVLCRRLPVQNVVGGSLALLGLSTLWCALSARNGVPLGQVEYSTRLGLRLIGLVPLTLPFLWVGLLLTGRETARLMLRPLRRDRFYGYYLLLVSSVLLALVEVALEPYATQVVGWWAWPEATLWQGLPWGTLVAWLLSAAFMLMMATPWLVPKRPIPTTPTLHSPAIWLGLAVWFTLGDLRHELWGPGLIALAGIVVVAVLTWQGYQIGLEAVTRRRSDDEDEDE
jgi:uncharacterized membrane protein